MAKNNPPKAAKVQIFTWVGINKTGQHIKGELEATNITLAKADLRHRGIIVKTIHKKLGSFFEKSQKRITQGDIAIFSRQLATMIAAGIPLVQAFDITARGQNNLRLQKLLLAIKTDIESGTTFAQALKKHPKYFNALFCNLIEAGEQSGSLDIMLDKVATYKEKTESIKGKIKKALFYPAAVLVVAFLVTAGLLIFVIPQFESLFQGFGADLPALTRLVIQLSEIFQAYWWLMFGGIGISIWLVLYFRNNSSKFAYAIDQISLKIPVIGNVLKNAAIARFSRTLAITFAAGLPLVDALRSVAGATGNILYANATDSIRENVSSGQQMHVAMKSTRLFPNMVIQMISIGEESGSLEEMLSKTADFYEEDVDNAVDALSSLLEPLIMVVLGGLIGSLVIAMYLPIFKLGSVV